MGSVVPGLHDVQVHILVVVPCKLLSRMPNPPLRRTPILPLAPLWLLTFSSPDTSHCKRQAGSSAACLSEKASLGNQPWCVSHPRYLWFDLTYFVTFRDSPWAQIPPRIAHSRIREALAGSSPRYARMSWHLFSEVLD